MEISYLKIYGDMIDHAARLSDADFGQLVRGMWEYSLTGQAPQLDGGAYYVWPFFEAHADACIAKSKTNQANAARANRSETGANGSETERTGANQSESERTRAYESEVKRTGANESERERNGTNPSEAEQPEAIGSEPQKNADPCIHITYTNNHISNNNNINQEEEDARARAPDTDHQGTDIMTMARSAGLIHKKQDAAVITKLMAKHPADWMTCAIEQCQHQGASDIRYLCRILQGYTDAGGIDTLTDQPAHMTKAVIEQAFDQRPNSEPDGSSVPAWIQEHPPDERTA